MLLRDTWRPAIAAGVVLILAGLIVLFYGLTYTSERSVLKLGDIEASVEEKHTIPKWLGIVALAGGAALIALGRRRPPPDERA